MGPCVAIAYAVTAVAAVAGAAVAVHGEQVAGNQAEANAKFMSDQAAADAAAAQGAATVEAQRIRQLGKQQQGAAIAAAAASGVDVNSQTAVKIDSTIKHNAEEDAYMTIIQGDEHASRINQQGAIDRLAGKSAQIAASNQETATLIGAAGQVAQIGINWKTARPPAKTPTGTGG